MEDALRFFKLDLLGGAQFPANAQQPIKALVVLIYPRLRSATHQQPVGAVRGGPLVMDTEARSWEEEG